MVFFNFAFGGHALFGAFLDSYSTPNKAINTSFLALLGDFNYTEMLEVAPITASLWFWSFMIFTSFILLNLLIAIIFDHYMVVRDEVGETKGLGTQSIQFIGELNWNLDWYLQRRKYLKVGILNPEAEKLFGTKSVEDLYDEFVQESGEGLKYGRQTILTAKKAKRVAEREALEKPKIKEESPKERRKTMRVGLFYYSTTIVEMNTSLRFFFE